MIAVLLACATTLSTTLQTCANMSVAALPPVRACVCLQCGSCTTRARRLSTSCTMGSSLRQVRHTILIPVHFVQTATKHRVCVCVRQQRLSVCANSHSPRVWLVLLPGRAAVPLVFCLLSLSQLCCARCALASQLACRPTMSSSCSSVGHLSQQTGRQCLC